MCMYEGVWCCMQTVKFCFVQCWLFYTVIVGEWALWYIVVTGAEVAFTNSFTTSSAVIINIRLQLCVRPSVRACVTEGQRKSVDPESKTSASLDRATRRLREGCRRRRSRRHHLRVRALGRWACGTGVRWRLTLACVPRWLAKGPVPREAIGCGGSVEPGDCVPGFLRAEVSGEKRQER